MKSNIALAISSLSLAVCGVFVASSAAAATKPSHVGIFTTEPNQVLSVRPKSWRDPAFGDMGWTHSSDWGRVWVKKGQTVTITAVSSDAGVHPGITVWHRGKDDTAPNDWVVDHFYPQNANFAEFGAKDEATGKTIGDIVMKIVEYGYDQDGNTKHPKNMHGIKDGVPGQLVLSFKAERGGAYMFVVGGFNPDVGVDTTLKYDINTNVTVTGP
ncbi:MAG: copper(I)-binding protein CorA [Gammaproteobacteria bacterium]